MQSASAWTFFFRFIFFSPYVESQQILMKPVWKRTTTKAFCSNLPIYCKTLWILILCYSDNSTIHHLSAFTEYLPHQELLLPKALTPFFLSIYGNCIRQYSIRPQMWCPATKTSSSICMQISKQDQDNLCSNWTQYNSSTNNTTVWTTWK